MDINLEKLKPLEVYPHEETLAKTLVDKALENTELTSTPVGISLAAAFDLMVAAEYYTKIANKGWLYCPVNDYPLLIYPYTNTCPRCVLQGNFHFHKANKPPSGTIGKTTSRLLYVFLSQLFKINSRSLKIYFGTEPVDVIIHDETENTLLLAEVKAAPLTTLPLAVAVERQTEIGEEGELISCVHSSCDNSFISSSNLHFIIPHLEKEVWNHELISLGVRGSENIATWTYEQIDRVILLSPLP